MYNFQQNNYICTNKFEMAHDCMNVNVPIISKKYNYWVNNEIMSVGSASPLLGSSSVNL